MVDTVTWELGARKYLASSSAVYSLATEAVGAFEGSFITASLSFHGE